MAGFNIRNRFNTNSIPFGSYGQFGQSYSPLMFGAMRGSAVSQPATSARAAPPSQDNTAALIQLISALLGGGAGTAPSSEAQDASGMRMSFQKPDYRDIQTTEGGQQIGLLPTRDQWVYLDKKGAQTGKAPTPTARPVDQFQQGIQEGKDIVAQVTPQLPSGWTVAGASGDRNKIVVQDESGNRRLWDKLLGQFINAEARDAKARASGRLSPEADIPAGGGRGAVNAPVIALSEEEAKSLVSRPEFAPLVQRLMELEKRGGLQIISGGGAGGVGAPGGSAVAQPVADPVPDRGPDPQELQVPEQPEEVINLPEPPTVINEPATVTPGVEEPPRRRKELVRIEQPPVIEQPVEQTSPLPPPAPYFPPPIETSYPTTTPTNSVLDIGPVSPQEQVLIGKVPGGIGSPNLPPELQLGGYDPLRASRWSQAGPVLPSTTMPARPSGATFDPGAVAAAPKIYENPDSRLDKLVRPPGMGSLLE